MRLQNTYLNSGAALFQFSKNFPVSRGNGTYTRGNSLAPKPTRGVEGQGVVRRRGVPLGGVPRGDAPPRGATPGVASLRPFEGRSERITGAF